MRRSSRLIAATAVLALALTPGLAFARAGSSSSMGSRGSSTFSAPAPTNTAPGRVAPMERSTTTPTPSYGAPSPGMAPQAGFGARPSFMSGLMAA